MKIFIAAASKVKDIRKAFEQEFPYLKVEFVRKKTLAEPGLPEFEFAPMNSKLIDVSGAMKEGEIDISGNLKVAGLKQLFQSKCNLPVRIHPKTCTGSSSLIDIDNITLARLNRLIREACHAMYDEVVLL